jgi:hypothetical protein
VFSYINKQVRVDFISKKLDRVLSNFDWMKDFPNTSIDFLDRGISDYSPALISVDQFSSFGPKPFKFFNFWADHKDFLDWVAEGWRVHVEGFSMFQLYAKLKTIKAILKAKNYEVFGGLNQRVVRARQELANAQSGFMNSHENAMWHKKEQECLHAYTSLVTAEENFLTQKSRNQRLNLGVGNSAFFHKVVKVRNACNLVKVLKDDNGDSIQDAKQFEELAISFYRNLLGHYSHVFSQVKACRVSLCRFCFGHQECIEHLFFHCGFSMRIWRQLMEDCLVVDPYVRWDQIMKWSIGNLRGGKV